MIKKNKRRKKEDKSEMLQIQNFQIKLIYLIKIIFIDKKIIIITILME